MRRLATIPITTVAVSVTKIAIAAPFFNFHDRRVALKNAKWVVHCGSRRFHWNPTQQRTHHQHRSQKPHHGISSSVFDQSLSLVVFPIVCGGDPIRSDAGH